MGKVSLFFSLEENFDGLIDVLAIVGLTATGKTRLAIELAKALNGEVVSADSVQVYKDLSIGTAKPSVEECKGVSYHCIDLIDLDCIGFSVSDYVNSAKEMIFSIKKRGFYPIVCGGTGLYVDSLLNNVKFLENAKDTLLRKKLELIYRNRGIDPIYRELMRVDPEAASKIHKNNARRVIRALEVYLITGFTITEQVRFSKGSKVFNPIYVGLNYKNKENLVKSINSRVDAMIKSGLLEEANELLKKGFKDFLKRIIGYRELVEYFEGNGSITLSDAIEKIKIHTRQYAKRQMTWFKRNEKIKWFYVDEEGSFENLFLHVKNYVEEEKDKMDDANFSENYKIR